MAKAFPLLKLILTSMGWRKISAKILYYTYLFKLEIVFNILHKKKLRLEHVCKFNGAITESFLVFIFWQAANKVR